MTGFGRASAVAEGRAIDVQVSSVNRKTLDLTIALPEAWEPLETAIGEAVRKVAVRGKVHVAIDLARTPSAAGPAWDEAMAHAALDRLAALAAQRGVAFAPTPELLWQVVSAQRQATELPALEGVQPVLLAAVEAALKEFSAMRAKEGSALLADFLARLDLLRTHVAAVAEQAPQVPAYQREQLLKRLRESGLELKADDERVLKEVALFADRCDITEELTRLKSHFDQFAALLKSGGEIGRKSEFILQEIGREVHTIGSKANDLTISRRVIELKNELERVREQIANVE